HAEWQRDIYDWRELHRAKQPNHRRQSRRLYRGDTDRVRHGRLQLCLYDEQLRGHDVGLGDLQSSGCSGLPGQAAPHRQPGGQPREHLLMARLGRSFPYKPRIGTLKMADVSAALTGSALTSAVGTVAVSITLTLTGIGCTASPGTLGPQNAPTITGIGATGSSGTLLAATLLA